MYWHCGTPVLWLLVPQGSFCSFLDDAFFRKNCLTLNFRQFWNCASSSGGGEFEVQLFIFERKTKIVIAGISIIPAKVSTKKIVLQLFSSSKLCAFSSMKMWLYRLTFSYEWLHVHRKKACHEMFCWKRVSVSGCSKKNLKLSCMTNGRKTKAFKKYFKVTFSPANFAIKFIVC